MLNVIPIATSKTVVQRYTLTDMLEISKWNSKKKQNKHRKQNKIKW